MVPKNIIHRLQGPKRDVVVVQDDLGLEYYVAYQYSRERDQWRFHLDPKCYRYTTIKSSRALSVARRLYKNHNV